MALTTGLSGAANGGAKLGSSLRTRLIFAFVGVTLLTVLAVSIASAFVLRGSLLTVVGNRLATRVEEESALIGQLVSQQVTSLQVLALNQSIQAGVGLSNLQYPSSEASTRARLADMDQQWAAATSDDIIIRSRVAESVVAINLRAYRDLAPDNVELIVADAFGGVVAATERTSDYDQSDEAWWQAARRGEIYLGQPALDESAGVVGLILAVPVHNPGDGSIMGVVRTTYRFEAIGAQVIGTQVGDTGGATLAMSHERWLDASGQISEIDAVSQQSLLAADAAGFVIGELAGRGRLLSVAPIVATPEVTALGWEYVVYQDEAEAMAPIAATQNAGIIVAIVALLGVGTVAAILAGRISAPLSRLSAAARGLAAGDLSRRVGLSGDDEIGQLASSFDTMAASLEQRAASEQEAQAASLRLQEEVIRVQRETLKELATPLIPLNSRTLLLPLIGSIDRERAEQIFQALLQGVARHRAKRVIIDLTGTPQVDAQVAEILLRAAQGARLLGAEVSLTGISAALARTLVGLDLQLDEIVVQANLESALMR
jgi:anti-anti-sigma regulatory factor/HAMP domain-containing protein